MKKPFAISIEEEDLDVLRLFCEKTGMSISSLYENHTKGLVKAAKLSGLLDKKKVGKLDLIKFFGKAAMMDV